MIEDHLMKEDHHIEEVNHKGIISIYLLVIKRNLFSLH